MADRGIGALQRKRIDRLRLAVSVEVGNLGSIYGLVVDDDHRTAVLIIATIASNDALLVDTANAGHIATVDRQGAA